MGVESGHTTMLSLLDVINPVVNLGICVGFGTKLELDLANFDRAEEGVPTSGTIIININACSVITRKPPTLDKLFWGRWAAFSQKPVALILLEELPLE